MVRIRFDEVPNENTKFLDIDRTYLRKKLLKLDDDTQYASLTVLGELYGIELAAAENVVVLDSNNELTDFGIKWIAEQFAEHKIDSKLLAKVKA
ncbi:hypothetical protein [Methanosarcina sp.]|uniref:hypothetical protein n=1 Tax=Methanosarcina sp. TaxID=2213 RepID=UPI002C649C7C|nr:hypothetical protein [Methanosarcina sp.]HOW13519.1 hypothetical protein [Methanosarcina sp.]